MAQKNKKNTSSLKKVIRKIHLYLGLTTGIIVFIIAITGCLWVFKEEITALTSNVPTVEVQNKEVLNPTEVKKIAQSVYPNQHIHGTLYKGNNNPIEVIFYQKKPEEFYRSVFLNPWSGEVIHQENHLEGFFHFVLDGHMYLWLPHKVGEVIVEWSTVIFFLMIISGIILWWPKNKKIRKQRLWFKWKPSTKWKRKNYDLHQIIGFYASFIAIILVFTGLVMAFDNFAGAVYYGIGGDKDIAFQVPKNKSKPLSGNDEDSKINELLPLLNKKYPSAKDFEIHYPYNEEYSIYVEVSNSDGLFYDSDYKFYDQKTLEELKSTSIYGNYNEANFSDMVLRMNYDIHIGAIGGIAGKILAFIISLFCASLPITGFLLWYGRNYKKKA